MAKLTTAEMIEAIKELVISIRVKRACKSL